MILYLSLGSAFVAAWLYFACGVGVKWPEIVYGGYEIAESSRKFIETFGVPLLVVGRHVEHSKKEMREARDKCFERIVRRAERIAREEVQNGYHAMKPRPWLTFKEE